MTQAEIENHIETAERFLRHAEEQFEAGDMPQASEKAWGAVAHYLKSEAKFRGWRNSSHSDLSDIAYDLAHETDDTSRIERLYDGVNKLHANFYEDQLDDREVAEGVGWARELIWQLESNARSPLGERPSHLRRRGRST
jgi:HEPN domain-containing protein